MLSSFFPFLLNHWYSYYTNRFIVVGDIYFFTWNTRAESTRMFPLGDWNRRGIRIRPPLDKNSLAQLRIFLDLDSFLVHSSTSSIKLQKSDPRSSQIYHWNIILFDGISRCSIGSSLAARQMDQKIVNDHVSSMRLLITMISRLFVVT